MNSIYYCEMCSTPVYTKFGSGRFCNRSCSNKWVALNQSDEAKKRKAEKGKSNLIHDGLTYKYTKCELCGKDFKSNRYKICLNCRKESHTKERKLFLSKKNY